MRILWAAETGNVDVVTEMLNKDASLIAATDADGYTPLHRASYEGHCHIVEVSTALYPEMFTFALRSIHTTYLTSPDLISSDLRSCLI